jgi:hypothetical protein
MWWHWFNDWKDKADVLEEKYGSFICIREHKEELGLNACSLKI